MSDPPDGLEFILGADGGNLTAIDGAPLLGLAVGQIIDYLLKYADINAAKVDLATLLVNGNFPTNMCVAGIQVWQTSADVGGVHSYLPGYWVMLSLPVNQSLLTNAALQFAINRGLSNGAQVGAVVKSNVANALLQDIKFQPLFAGANYPFGSLQ